MILRIAHIGIAVKNIESSKDIFSKIFEIESPYSEHVPTEKVNISYLPVGDTLIELLEGTDAASTLNKFIDKKGEGIHHISLEVDDIKFEVTRLKKLGFKFVNEEPSIGGDGFIVVFLHPKSTNGVLIELCQKK
ncbi:MAG: methylmalonyl-CoA epimerase [Ignavibacteria bacterium]|nr:methylmalonyl-CoA epimerase [Bacteroidota bacterium]MSQ46597.1 methylmalonyl-CoA epimerase [Ignavibacteria bacterium]